MKYDNSTVRRQDRLLPEERAKELLMEGEYGVLSMTEDGIPYGIPVNFVWNGESSLYIHCAIEGKKLRILDKNPDVSFCIVGRTCLRPDKFTTEYESVILSGKATRNLPDEEKWEALGMLLRKFSPNDMEKGLKYSKGSFNRVEILRLDIVAWSGKTKNFIPDKPEAVRKPL